MSWLDLHMHSIYSDDGQYSCEELMKMCDGSGVRIAAVSDHNDVSGVGQALEIAENYGIELIPAVELDCVHEGVNLHILGYWINYQDERFYENLDNILKQEQQASRERVALIRQLGIYVDEAKILKIAKDGVITGEMIAEVAIASEKNRNNDLLEPYSEDGNRSDNPYVNFYWDFCSQGKPGYVEINYMSLKEAIDLIEDSGGIAVLAHPGNNIKEDEKLLKEIVEAGISGIEVYSSYHTEEQMEFYVEQAKLFDLAISCGSDFHGKTKPMISIGSVDCKNLEDEIINSLRSKRHTKI